MTFIAPSQMDIFEAMQRHEAGVDQVLEHAPVEYRDRLWAAVQTLAARRVPFCSDDARAIAGDPPADCHPNVAGAIFNRAAAAGLIRTLGFTKSARVIGNGNWVRQWIGCSS